ncbi:hypothetical protein OHA_1_01540 [Pleomorphomonas sp. SM30]|uniref:Antitoxin n=2 Tax=Oharaeibacter diazotrophicus TaxID=1920512 RepID=A0A4R6RAV6_9HYPH|nr:hypothetical protein EDD54_3080 [Oharaeibacter diazotrophicus]BBE71954.1 hypothetical protein OHA_1_01540 [Pleomorphomonas sp. SM30]GLS78718.1 hypothetical protein GCM10007904_40550 [Oharaeibacter diazotrophicus]
MRAMDITLNEAKTRLDELAARARAGETIVLTAPGEPSLVMTRDDGTARTTGANRLAPDGTIERFNSVDGLFSAARPPTTEEKARRRRLLEDLAASVRAGDLRFKTDGARSQDFLYDDDGMPG